FAEVHAVLPAKQAVLTLPERAITYNPYGNSVFVVSEADGNKTVNRVQVTTGGITDGRIEILTGLEPGMGVVPDGHHKLRSAQRVSIDNSSMPDGSGIGQ